MKTESAVTPLRREPRVYSRAEHNISRRNISEEALKVLYRLDGAGFRACLVGGGVRDLLLGLEPKDFDIATDALPEQVRELFRNSRLIGRRFRLAHVRFGREIIEVATFRASPDDGDGELETTSDGRILRDNVYGTIDDDVWRRDFTANALYYDIHDFSVIDYVGGVEDIKQGRMRLIGDAERRFREDPVRMLRAIRFAVKLGFQLDQAAQTGIEEHAHLLSEISPARLFDEMLKLFHGGHALQTFESLRRYNLFAGLFAQCEESLEHQHAGFPNSLIKLALENTDKRIAAGQSVTPGFLIAAFLWDAFDEQRESLVAGGVNPHDAITQAADTVISRQIAQIAIPRRFTQMTREIWALQYRLNKLQAKRVTRLFEHPRFRAAYDFIVLRAEAGEPVTETATWWTSFQAADDDAREQMLAALKPGKSARSRRRRPRRKKAE